MSLCIEENNLDKPTRIHQMCKGFVHVTASPLARVISTHPITVVPVLHAHGNCL
jgi:hypothetical protein